MFGDTKRRVNVQLRQITELQGYLSLVELRLLLIVYLTHYVYMGKKSQWKTGILLKIDLYSEDDTFDTSKPGNLTV